MKQLFTMLLFTSSICLYAQEKSHFRIYGTIPGLKKGMTVSIIKAESDDKQTINAEDIELGLVDFDTLPKDSNEIATATITKNGKFLLEGTINHPQLCTLITNNLELMQKISDSNNNDSIHWTYTPIFLSNDDIEVKVANYNLWTDEPLTDDFIIVGGEAQNDFNTYNLMLKKAGEQNNDFAPPVTQDLLFIDTHPSSIVSLYLANRILTNGYNLSSEQIKHLEEIIKPCAIDPVRYKKFIAKSKMAELTAIGNPIVDLNIEDVNRMATMLTSVMPKAQLTLVDFWASWCGICRACTPEIKELYKGYSHDIFDVISVSCDTHHENWIKAMKTDDMPWKQYILTKQGYDDFFAKYQLTGVPYYLLVNADGKVIGNPGNISHIKDVIKQYCQ